MTDENENDQPPKIEIPQRKVVKRKRQTKKLPKINLSQSAASGTPTSIPKVGVTSNPNTSTSRIDLPEDPEDYDAATATVGSTAAPEDVTELPSEPTALSEAGFTELPSEPTALSTEAGFTELPSEPTALSTEAEATFQIDEPEEADASSNATMRISIEQEIVDDGTTEVSPADSKEVTEEISLDNTESGSIGVTAEPSTSTSRIQLDETMEVAPPEPEPEPEPEPDPVLELEAESELSPSMTVEVEAAKNATMPIDLADEVDEQEVTPTLAPEDLPEQTLANVAEAVTEPNAVGAGGDQLVEIRDDIEESADLLKAVTVPMDLDEFGDGDEFTMDSSEDVTIIPDQSVDELLKASTAPVDEGIEEDVRGSEEFMKSATVPMDPSELLDEAPTAPKARKRTMKISRSEVKTNRPQTVDTESPETEKPVTTPATAGINRPRTIKLKRPDEQQIKTVKLKKAPESGGEEAAAVEEQETVPGRQKTIKLKRPGSSETASPSQAKTLQLNRPASVQRPASVASGFKIDDVEESSSDAPGVVWAIVASLGLIVSGGAVWFLYQAYKLAETYM